MASATRWVLPNIDSYTTRARIAPTSIRTGSLLTPSGSGGRRRPCLRSNVPIRCVTSGPTAAKGPRRAVRPGSPAQWSVTSPAAHDGYRAGSAAYRRISVALFAAGLATFALLYSTQPLLPELARDFDVTAAAEHAVGVAVPPSASGWRCWWPARSPRCSAAPA